MKNPLWKRLPRELVSEFGKYLAIFLFMTGSIGFVSGFLVADDSMITAYNESFEKYNIEDGNFTLSSQASDRSLEKLEESEAVTIEESFYIEDDVDADGDSSWDGTMRIYKNRTGMNLVCLMDGAFPEEETEIAVDRMYADNNDISVGDVIVVGENTLTVTGLVALSDYSALFSDNSDMMFDSVKFGVAIMTEEGFDGLEDGHLTYRYSWQYDSPCADETEEKERSEDLIEALAERLSLTDAIPRYLNQAIQFTGDDMGGDKTMMEVLLYILIVIMAFLFAVTTSNTIVREAAVIGTLRASGYTRRELLVHYCSVPMAVTLLAALAGNMLGYTVFKDMVAALYYGSYSLPTYVTLWNGEAFLMTTLIPLALMAVINVLLISSKLRLSPLKFLRRDLSTSKRKRAVRLPNFRFFTRFRIRIILQNKSGYLTLLAGVIFANVLLFFGMLMGPLLNHYQEEVTTNLLANYQYILNVEEDDDETLEYTLTWALERLLTPSYETKNETAEKFCMTSLKNMPKNREGESFSVYGIQADSAYVQLPGDGIYISDGISEKYAVRVGDVLTLKEPYGEETYDLTVEGIYEYPGGLAVFLPIDVFRQIFDEKEDYFNGYFSDTEITDLDDDLIAATVTVDDLTKTSRQLTVSMGEMFQMLNVFAVVLFALLIYLLTRLIIEKNGTSISMVKILGYENREIVGLYLVSTTWVVIFSVLLSLVVSVGVIRVLYRYLLSNYSGWLTFYIKPSIYPEMAALGLGAYALVAVLQFRKIRKIPMDEALKNVE